MTTRRECCCPEAAAFVDATFVDATFVEAKFVDADVWLPRLVSRYAGNLLSLLLVFMHAFVFLSLSLLWSLLAVVCAVVLDDGFPLCGLGEGRCADDVCEAGSTKVFMFLETVVLVLLVLLVVQGCRLWCCICCCSCCSAQRSGDVLCGS